MPTPKLFKKSSSKVHPPDDDSAVNVVEKDKVDMPQPSIMSPGNAVPAYSDNVKELWAAVNKEQPQKQGAEKLLDKIGMSTNSHVHTFPAPSLPHMYAFIQN